MVLASNKLLHVILFNVALFDGGAYVFFFEKFKQFSIGITS